jgi:nucleotide-binding universal stress UspA family protein
MAKIERIMFPTDLSDVSRAAIPWISRVAALTDAEVLLVHILPEEDAQPNLLHPPRMRENHRDMRAKLKKRLHELAGSFPDQLRVRPLLLFGDVRERILRGVKDYGIDMIVIPTHGRGGWRNPRFRSVAQAVIRSAPCPVLTVKRPNAVGRSRNGNFIW